MEWAKFHHPDLSLPVIRRKATEEFLDLLLGLGEMVAARGWSRMLGSTFPNSGAYRSAMYRLKKRGLIAYRREGGHNPVLRLTPAGEAQRPDVFRPHRHWDRKWNRIWYVLMYDVPETERHYRTALRGFLRRMRMGCLQKSVWVTPCDIRPDFDDLMEAGGLDSFAYLLEARTVLGQKPGDIVDQAWAFDRLGKLHAEYCRVTEMNLSKLHSVACTDASLVDLARTDIATYLQVMRDDPLLPRSLWPPGYRGPDVLRLHREIGKAIRRRLCETAPARRDPET